MTDQTSPAHDDAAETPLLVLARLVKRAREHPNRRWSIETAAKAGDMAVMTWRRIEEGQRVRSLTYTGVEQALGWPSGSIAAFLEGGAEPTATVPPDQASEAPHAPTIYEASVDDLLDEVRRRYRHLARDVQVSDQPMTLTLPEAASGELATVSWKLGAASGDLNEYTRKGHDVPVDTAREIEDAVDQALTIIAELDEHQEGTL